MPSVQVLTDVTRSLPRRIAHSLIALLALGCGGGDNQVTAVDTTPNVTGRYQAITNLAAVTCTPQSPPAGGGTVIFTAFSDTVLIRILQSGARLTLTYPEFPGSSADTGQVAQDGTVTYGYKETFREEPRAGNRTFFVDLTASQVLRRPENTTRLTGTGSYVNVFHEGSATAPVFATCSRTSTVELTRVGD